MNWLANSVATRPLAFVFRTAFGCRMSRLSRGHSWCVCPSNVLIVVPRWEQVNLGSLAIGVLLASVWLLPCVQQLHVVFDEAIAKRFMLVLI